ncbi:MAG: hypothetical protein OHK0039_47840 [Bacteroidia bacterium]
MDTLFPITLDELAHRLGCLPKAVATCIRQRTQPPWGDEDLLMMLRCAHLPAREAGIGVFRKMMYRMEMKLVRDYRLDDETAHDLRQDAYLSLHRQLIKPGWKPERASLSSYYFTIFKNKIHELHRKKGRMPLIPIENESGDAPVLQIPDKTDDILTQMLSADQRTEVRALVERLPEKRRIAIRMRFYEELPYEEIQAYFGHQTVSVTRNLVSAAFGQLREMAEAQGLSS